MANATGILLPTPAGNVAVIVSKLTQWPGNKEAPVLARTCEVVVPNPNPCTDISPPIPGTCGTDVTIGAGHV